MNALVDKQGIAVATEKLVMLVRTRVLATSGKLLKQHDVKTYFAIQTKS